ncbi:MAG: alpha-N-arabinofuranosidase, partial [Clostridia bacterium]|nr:alpha-N-arabinofuranosidase [Clostridia bacterium]
RYWSNRANDTPTFLAETVKMDGFIRDVIAACDYVKSIKRSKKTINLSFDEWNVWYHSKDQDTRIEPWCQHPHQLEDIYNFEDALLVGGAMITLLRHADRVKIACLAQLVNVIAPIMTSDTGAWKQTIYYPFMHASTLGRGKVLYTTVITPTYECKLTDCAPYLDAVVIENDEEETLTVFAVNKSLDEDMELVCDLRQYADYDVVRHIVLEHENLKAVNTEENPNEVAPHEGGVSKNDAGHFTAVLNAKSWNVIRLQKRK